jgi:hypothetical protein
LNFFVVNKMTTTVYVFGEFAGLHAAITAATEYGHEEKQNPIWQVMCDVVAARLRACGTVPAGAMFGMWVMFRESLTAFFNGPPGAPNPDGDIIHKALADRMAVIKNDILAMRLKKMIVVECKVVPGGVPKAEIMRRNAKMAWNEFCMEQVAGRAGPVQPFPWQ